MSMGERIRNARKAKGLTQKQLAEQIGAKHTSVSGWEKDQHKPDVDSLELICGALDVPISYLIEIEQNERQVQRLLAYQQSTFEIEIMSMFRKLSLDEKNMIYDLMKSTLDRKEKK